MNLSPSERRNAKRWRENKINNVLQKLKRREKASWIEESFCRYWKKGWIFEFKWET